MMAPDYERIRKATYWEECTYAFLSSMARSAFDALGSPATSDFVCDGDAARIDGWKIPDLDDTITGTMRCVDEEYVFDIVSVSGHWIQIASAHRELWEAMQCDAFADEIIDRTSVEFGLGTVDGDLVKIYQPHLLHTILC